MRIFSSQTFINYARRRYHLLKFTLIWPFLYQCQMQNSQKTKSYIQSGFYLQLQIARKLYTHYYFVQHNVQVCYIILPMMSQLFCFLTTVEVSHCSLIWICWIFATLHTVRVLSKTANLFLAIQTAVIPPEHLPSDTKNTKPFNNAVNTGSVRYDSCWT